MIIFPQEKDGYEEDIPCGKIINMASIAGRGGREYMCAYSASKATAIIVTQAAALEFAPKLTVNSICPGPVDTAMWNRSTASGPNKKAARSVRYGRNASA